MYVEESMSLNVDITEKVENTYNYVQQLEPVRIKFRALDLE